MTSLTNHSSTRLRWGMAALLACLCTAGQAYNFVNWTFSSNVASGNVGSLGIATVSTTSPSTAVLPWGIQFNSVPFTPTLTTGIGVQQTFGMQQWGFTINLAGLTNTNGVIVGLGNFGHGSNNYPGYRLEAYDSANNLMSLGGFGVIGSYDHDWITPPAQFNDDLSLNLNTGDFTATVIPGLNDINSDILFLQLPTGVSRLEVFTPRESLGDTVNVVMATRDAVPEPFTMSLLAAGVIAAMRRRKALQNR